MAAPAEIVIGRPRTELLISPEQKAPSLKLSFNGQGDGAAKVLRQLMEHGHEIVGVVATKNEEDPVRKLATETGIPIVNLGVVNKPKSIETMQSWNADLGVGFFLQASLDQGVYSIPEYGTMNFHLSLLNKRRGRDSMNWAVLKGDKYLGASWFLMSKKIDAGPIVRQIKFTNNEKSQGAQYFEHLDEFITNTADAVDEMAVGIDIRRKSTGREKLPLVAQDPKTATEDPPMTLKHTRVSPRIMRADTIIRTIQAGGPGTWVMRAEGGRLFLSKPSLDTSGIQLLPGETSVVDRGLALGTRKGVLIAGSVGSDPKEKIPAQDYVNQKGPIQL